VKPFHLVAYTDASVRGGAEQTLGTLLAELDPAIRVTVLGVDRTVADWVAERRPGTAVELVPEARNKADVRAVAAHVAAVRRLRPDILHVNDFTPWRGQYAQLAGLVTPGVRVVVSEHSTVPSSSTVQRWAKRNLSRAAAAHVACGVWLAAEVERLLGRRAGSLRCIHNGIPPVLPPPTTDLPEGFVVGTVGRLSAEKGFDVLLRAAARVPGIEVVLVGQGPEAEPLQALAVELGIADRVHLTGWVEDSREYLVGYDVFALPSHTEGFPLTTLEAMLGGVAVVASDVGGVSESVVHERTGLLVRPGDVDGLAAALGRLVDDEGLRRRLAEDGRALVRERFTAPTMARRWEELYLEVLSR
jgi:glycosyltransferase involved in cell wall biosynthesis